jgi:hypothetical protein
MLIKKKDKLIKKAIISEKLVINKRIIQENNDLISLYNSKNKDTIIIVGMNV